MLIVCHAVGIDDIGYASSLANIQWQQFRYMADAIQREDACQGELELLHGRRTARKTNAVKIATDVTQARLQISNGSNSAIWRTPYSERTPVRANSSCCMADGRYSKLDEKSGCNRIDVGVKSPQL